ncbi:hypothetical protein CEXT_488661 [Caerostris extrusa]|uniref:Uncharacterized protein n=1 Tax=Caerostris extrusa TaxID=172846 RepID=A0AAV4NP66_CAEEX|nr:hypothetical protein CEXT_488661 [Caerostris extrusa]
MRTRSPLATTGCVPWVLAERHELVIREEESVGRNGDESHSADVTCSSFCNGSGKAIPAFIERKDRIDKDMTLDIGPGYVLKEADEQRSDVVHAQNGRIFDCGRQHLSLVSIRTPLSSPPTMEVNLLSGTCHPMKESPGCCSSIVRRLKRFVVSTPLKGSVSQFTDA